MKLFIENVLNEQGEPHGELYIESNDSEFQVVHYSEINEKGKSYRISTLHYLTFGGCLRNIMHRKIKESTTIEVKTMLDRLEEIETYIRSIKTE
jgi:hypothetical protein